MLFIFINHVVFSLLLYIWLSTILWLTATVRSREYKLIRYIHDSTHCLLVNFFLFFFFTSSLFRARSALIQERYLASSSVNSLLHIVIRFYRTLHRTWRYCHLVNICFFIVVIIKCEYWNLTFIYLWFLLDFMTKQCVLLTGLYV